jgi:hypothetical protein
MQKKIPKLDKTSPEAFFGTFCNVWGGKTWDRFCIFGVIFVFFEGKKSGGNFVIFEGIFL